MEVGGWLGRWALLAVCVCPLPALAAANLGFESGADGWQLSAADQAVVIDGSESFSVYEDFGIVNAPLRGGFSLLLGEPKQVNEQQNRGPNTALSPAFVPVASELVVSFRLLSLEHRGDDRLIFEVLGETAPVTTATFSVEPFDPPHPLIGPGSGPIEGVIASSSCGTGNRCEYVIDIGNRSKRPYDSGAYRLRIGGLPTDREVRLRYTVIGGDNSAHATWAQFDDANAPPVVDFTFYPGGPELDETGTPVPGTAGVILEGDAVTFLSQAADPNGDELELSWFLDGAPAGTGAIGLLSFAQDGSYQVTLRASDGESQAETAQTVTVENAAPLLQPLTLVEVAENGVGEALCNWLDPGVEDPAVVNLSIPGLGVNETFDSALSGMRETVPALASGQETVTFQVAGPGTFAGTCAVTDDRTTSTAPFTVVVLPDRGASGPCPAGDLTCGAINLRETQDNDSTVTDVSTGEGPPFVFANSTTVGRINSPDDLDVYRVCLPAAGYQPGASTELPAIEDCDATQVAGVSFQQLPTKSKVLLTLDSPGADYDLLAFVNADEESPFRNAPFIGAPFIGAPFIGADFENAPFIGAVFGSLPFIGAPFIGAPFIGAPFIGAATEASPFIGAPFIGAGANSSPFIGAGSDVSDPASYVIQYRNVPRTELFGAPSGSTISGVDVNFTETGSDSLKSVAAENVQFLGLSANVDGQEQLLVEISPGKTLYVVVTPTNGSFSSAPYSLGSQVSVPLGPDAIFPGLCDGTGEPYVAPADATSSALSVYPAGSGLSADGFDTYIITQKQRYMRAYGMSESDWNAFIGDLAPYLDAVNAKLVSLPSTIYDPADADFCNVEAQNALAEDIREFLIGPQGVLTGNASVEYLQILGSNLIVPPRYVPDETTILNESLYGPDLLATPSPLAFAFGQGYNASYGYYGSFEPIPYRGRFLYLPDLSVSLLLERPEEVLATTLGQLDAQGNLKAFPQDQGLVEAGYDFFVDGTDRAAEALSSIPGASAPISLNPTSVLDALGGSWTADDFRCFLLGDESVPGCSSTSAPGLSVANFHASHNACLPARDFEAGVDANDFSGAEVVNSTEAGDNLVGRLFLTIGCHSLLSLSDPFVPPAIAALDLPVSLERDWAQQGGTKVGPIGFGSGHDEQLRGSELMSALIAEELAAGWTLGQATTRAGQRYVASLVEVSPNDEDAIINHVVSGVPQAKVAGTPDPSPAGAVSQSAQQALSLTGTPFATGALDLQILEDADGDGSPTVFPYSPSLARQTDHPDGWGTWFTLDDRAEAIGNRTLLPRFTPPEFDFRGLSKTPDSGWIHGYLLRETATREAARFVDLVFEDKLGSDSTYGDPVFPVEQHDWITNVLEPQPCVATIAPTQLASAGVVRTRSEARQTTSVIGAQFLCRPEFGETVVKELNGKPKSVVETRGDFRVYTAMTLEALHPLPGAPVDDFDPPEVLSQAFVASSETNDVTATVSARDPNGMRAIVFLVYRPVDCASSPGFAAECAEGRAGVIDSEEIVFTPGAGGAYPTQVNETRVLAGAKGLRFAVQYVDTAGNVVMKSLKGALQQALETRILNAFISQSDNDLLVFVQDLANLSNATLLVRVWNGEVDPESTVEAPFLSTLFELNIDGFGCSDPTGTLSCDLEDGIITVGDLQVGDLADGSITIEVTVRAQGAFGRDVATIGPCLDAVDDVLDPLLQDANFVGCGFRAEGTRVFVNMAVNGTISDAYQYRMTLLEFGGQVKLNDLSKVTGPPQSQPGFAISEDGTVLTLSFDAASVGWDGVSPVTVSAETQAGVKGKPEAGFIDQMTFPGVP